MSLLLFTVIVSAALAIAVGSNDETFAAVVGARRLTVNQAVVLGAVLILVGSLTLGQNVSETISNDLADIDFAGNAVLVLSVLIAVAFTLLLASYFGLPVSTTHAMVGAVTFIAIYIDGAGVVNWWSVGRVFASWFISPLLGFIGAFLVYHIVSRIKQNRVKNLDDEQRIEGIFANLLLVFVCITSISRAGNDVSNAVAPLLPAFSDSDFPLFPLLLGGIGMGIGLGILGRRVIKTLSAEVVSLTPATALSVQVSTALVTFIAAFLGIPVSGTHILVASFVGVGVASKTVVNYDTVKKIAFSAFTTPPLAGVVSIFSYFVLNQFL